MTVTSPKGFRASGVAAGLKTTGNPDVALVVNDGPDSTVAGVFTGNRVKAAPVRWSLVSARIQGFAANRYARHTLTGLELAIGAGGS